MFSRGEERYASRDSDTLGATAKMSDTRKIYHPHLQERVSLPTHPG